MRNLCARLATSVLLPLLVLSASPGGPSRADPVDRKEFRDYHRQHILELTFDAYNKNQALPEQLTLKRDEALSQFVAARDLPCSITWIGHSTFLLRFGNISILTDPIFSSHASPLPPLGPRRLVRPGIRLKDLPRIDAILLSHSHYDHTDFPSLQRLAKRDRRTTVFVPEAFSQEVIRAGFSRIVTHKAGQSSMLGALQLVSIDVPHKTGRNFHGTSHGYAQCWRVDDPGVKVFFCGDTPYGPEFRKMRQRHGKSDVALLPIGAYTPRWFESKSHINPSEAVRIGRDIGANTIVASHWGTFAMTPEPILEPPERFMKVFSPGIDKLVLKIGETFAPRQHCR